MAVLLFILAAVFAYFTYKLMWYPHISALNRTNEFGVQQFDSSKDMMRQHAKDGFARLLGILCLFITIGLALAGSIVGSH